jgi:anti-anti-sigma factor
MLPIGAARVCLRAGRVTAASSSPRSVIYLDGLSTSTTAPVDGTARIFLTGDLDLATRDRLRAEIRTALTLYRPEELVIDLTEVKLLDSAGIGALVGGWKDAHGAGCRLVVANPRPLAYWQLQLTGLLELFGTPAPPAGMRQPDTMLPPEAAMEACDG